MSKVTACLAVLAVLCAPISSFARETVRICYEEWAPFAETRGDRPEGIQIEIMQRAFDRVHIPVDFFEMPYVRCLPAVKNGVFDAILASSNEVGLVSMSISVLRWELGMFVHEDDPDMQFASLAEFSGKRAGLVDGYDYGAEINEYRKYWDIQQAPDALFNLRKLAKKRIDFTITDIIWAQTVIRAENLPIKLLPPTISSIPQYTLFNPTSADIIPVIEAAMNDMRADGTIEQIYQQQTGSGVPSRWLAQ